MIYLEIIFYVQRNKYAERSLGCKKRNSEEITILISGILTQLLLSRIKRAVSEMGLGGCGGDRKEGAQPRGGVG